jgi:hypothetical protein
MLHTYTSSPDTPKTHARVHSFRRKFPFSHGLDLVLFFGVVIQVFHQVGDIVVIVIGFIGTLGLILLELFCELTKSLEGIGAELI